MELLLWVLAYALEMLFCLCIVRWGGAKWLEGTFLSGLLIHFFAPRWSAEGIKLFVWLTMLLSTIWFVVGLFRPDCRV
jgi:hypothetical protein